MNKFSSRREFLAASAGVAGAAVLPWASSPALAQEAKWPAKVIRIVVPFPAGSITDTMARMLASGLAKSLGQPVIIDNKGGANGSIGVAEVARAAADGYTLLATNSSSITVNPLIYKNSPYKASSLAPITVVLDAPFILNVNPDWAKSNAINSVQDLIAYARRKPSELTYGSAGAGNLAHLGYAMLSNSAKIQTTHVPYKAASQASMAVMAGEVNSSFDTLASVPQILSGKLKALAVTSNERLAQMPDVPTMAQAGFADISVKFWLGLLAPAGTPAAIVEELYAHAKMAMAVPAAHAALSAQGVVVMQSPQYFANRIATEVKELAEVIKREKISLD